MLEHETREKKALPLRLFSWVISLLVYTIFLIVFLWVIIIFWDITTRAFTDFFIERNWNIDMPINTFLAITLVVTLIYIFILIFCLKIMLKTSRKGYQWFSLTVKEIAVKEFDKLKWMERTEEEDILFAQNIKLLGKIAIYLHFFLFPVILIWAMFGLFVNSNTFIFFTLPYFITFFLALIFSSSSSWVVKTINRPITNLIVHSKLEKKEDV